VIFGWGDAEIASASLGNSNTGSTRQARSASATGCKQQGIPFRGFLSLHTPLDLVSRLLVVYTESERNATRCG
jgi:hypothetical protein